MNLRRARLALLWAVSIAATFALYWTRRFSFGDPIVDFGSEVYVAWRLSLGEHLYRDLSYPFGPVAPYLSALWLRVLGESRETLVLANFGVYLAALAALSACLRGLFSRASAPLAVLFASLLFAFGQTVIFANYNFLTPYRFSVTYALLFSAAALACALRLLREPRGAWAVALGALAALTAFTKAEMFLILAVSLLWWRWCLRSASPDGGRRVARIAGAAFLGAVAIFLLLFHLVVGLALGEAAFWLLHPFAILFRSDFVGLPFYERMRGEVSLEALGLLVAAAAALPALAFALRRLLPPGRSPLPVLLAVGALAGGAAASFALSENLAQWTRITPLLCWLAFGYLALRFRAVRTRRRRLRAAAFGMLSLYAAALASKVIFNANADRYGFALALPASLAVFLFLFDRVPRWPRWRVHRAGWQVAWCLLLLPHARYFQGITQDHLRAKPVEITNAQGRFHFSYYPRDAAWLGELVLYLKPRVSGLSVTFLPEGSFLNFMLDRPSPLHYLHLMPDQVLFFGAGEVVAQMRRAPADFVVLLPRDVQEFGLGTFAEGYGKPVMDFVRAEYRRATDLPSALREVGVEVYLR